MPHENIVHFFEEAKRGERLTHAYCFYGPLGIGKTTLLRTIAKRVLCTGKGDDRCAACIASEKNQHPDFFLVDPDTEENTETIPIAAVRSIIHTAHLKPVLSPCKVLAIAHVDRCTIEALQALLKLLEDPPRATMLLLSTEYIHRLPATVRSRLQRFVCSKASTDASAKQYAEEEHDGLQEWIELFRNPLSVFRRFADTENTNHEFRSMPANGLILFHDFFRLRFGMQPRLLSTLLSPSEMSELHQRYTIEKIRKCSRAFFTARRLLHTNASPKLIIENLLLTFVS